MTLKVDNYINTLNNKLNSYDFGSQPAELYDPIRYILNIGGKRLRPLLTLLAYSLFKDEEIEKIYHPALGVEVFHNFTLMHDDIMDKAPLRRGQQTVHEKWNENIAILSGDVMLVRAYDLMLSCEDRYLRKVFEKFNTCAAEVCEGQQFDMNFETRMNVSEEEYIKMISLKTAALLGFSLELGAILAGEDISSCSTMKNIGINLGIGFQLKDDLLDVYGEAAKFGKQVGGDIISNKKTYLLIKALELAKGKVKEELEMWLTKKEFDATEKVQSVTNIYNSLDIKYLTEQKINNYFNEGLKLFDHLKVDENKKEPLKSFVHQLIDREK